MEINRHIVSTMIFVKMFLLYHTDAYTQRCPEALEWKIMSTTCKTNNVFHCLLHGGLDKYTIACRSWDWVQAGYYPILRGHFIDYALCSVNRYQPFVHRSNDNYHCEYSKSICSEEGQIESTQTLSTRTDRSCICNYPQGFDYVMKPGNGKLCIPSTNDCSCYKRRCQSGHLTSNYDCEPLITYKSDGKTKLKTTLNITSTLEKADQEPSRTRQQSNGHRKSMQKLLTGVILAAVISIIALATCILKLEIADACQGKSELDQEIHLAPDDNHLALNKMTETVSATDDMVSQKRQLTEKTKELKDKKAVVTNIRTHKTESVLNVGKKGPLSKGGKGSSHAQNAASLKQMEIRGTDNTYDKRRLILTGATTNITDIKIPSTVKRPISANRTPKTKTLTTSIQKTPSESKTMILPKKSVSKETVSVSGTLKLATLPSLCTGKASSNKNKSLGKETTRAKETFDIETQSTKSFSEQQKVLQDSKLSKSSEIKQTKGKKADADNKTKTTISTSTLTTKVQKPATEVTTRGKVNSLGNNKPNANMSTKAIVLTPPEFSTKSVPTTQLSGTGPTSVDKKRNRKSPITMVPLKQKSSISGKENTKVKRDRIKFISQPNSNTKPSTSTTHISEDRKLEPVSRKS